MEMTKRELKKLEQDLGEDGCFEVWLVGKAETLVLRNVPCCVRDLTLAPVDGPSLFVRTEEDQTKWQEIPLSGVRRIECVINNDYGDAPTILWHYSGAKVKRTVID